MDSNLKRILPILLLLLPSLAFAQGYHRLSNALTRGSGVAANVVPYAKVKVCPAFSECASVVNVYSDEALTHQIANPVTADASGNFSYYVASACVDEQTSAPGLSSFLTTNVCIPNSSTGSGVSSFNTRTGAVTLNATDVDAVGDLTNSTSGTAAKATALAGNPTQCSGGTPLATGIAANGDANCTAFVGNVLLNPSGNQTITQPDGTALGVNALVDGNKLQTMIQSVPSAYALYDMRGTSSTVVTDITGNGRNCTFGAGAQAPSLANGVLSFTATNQTYCNTTIPMSATQTIVARVNVPLAPNFPILQNLWSATDNTCGFYATHINFAEPGVSSGTIVNQNTTDGETVTLPIPGNAVIALVRDATSDRVYVNGVLSDVENPIGSTGCSGGFLRLGANLSGDQTSSNGQVSEFGVWNSALTQEQIQTVGNAFLASDEAKGYVPPVQNTSNGQLAWVEGDSRPYGVGGGTPIATQMIADMVSSGWSAVTTFAIPGQKMCQIASRTARLISQRSSAAKTNAVFLFGIGNDALAGDSLGNIESCFAASAKAFANAGFVVFAGDEVSANIPNWEATYRAPFNAWLRANYTTLGITALAPLSQDPDMGCVGCYTNTTYFDADQIHWTTAGANRIGSIAANTILHAYAGQRNNPSAFIVQGTTPDVFLGSVALSHDGASAYLDSVGGNTSTQGAFTFRDVAPGAGPLDSPTSYITSLADDGAGNWQAPSGKFGALGVYVPSAYTFGWTTGGKDDPVGIRWTRASSSQISLTGDSFSDLAFIGVDNTAPDLHFASGAVPVVSLRAADGTKSTTTRFEAGVLATKGVTSAPVLGTDANGFIQATTLVPVANGGTNTGTQTTNGVMYYDGTKITSTSAFTYTAGTGLNVILGSSTTRNAAYVSGVNLGTCGVVGTGCYTKAFALYDDSTFLDGIDFLTSTYRFRLDNSSGTKFNWSTCNYAGSCTTLATLDQSGRFAVTSISASALTASQLVATDASKVLVSTTALPSGTTATTQSAGDNSANVATTRYVDAAVARGISFTTTAATSDTYSFSGVTSTWHCSAPNPLDATAASNVAWVSSKTTGSITVTHPATAGLTYEVVCTPN